ncbi:MAG: hypothetical protein IIC22_01040 [Chloroflexi bacterium]|nr:hypothetical protein [Chloroflexota bacterium]
MKAGRFSANPIIYPGMDSSLGNNINGPSLIKVPDWLPDPLGRYYLYFAHHNGTFIRLAYADSLEGPWTIHKDGTLHLADAYCDLHVASPDVHVDDEMREIRMYYHGPVQAEGAQRSKLAVSRDGISFTASPENLGNAYFRVFRWDGYYYALGMPGVFYRSKDGRSNFEQGPTLFSRNMRHTALKLDGDVLNVFYTNAGDCPEQILHASIELTSDWMKWQESEATPVLQSETAYEGADMPLEPSSRGAIDEPVHQLRDPAIYREGDDTFLLYSVAGEQGIAIARLITLIT